MNRSTFLSVVVLLFILSGCKSSDTQNTPDVTPQVTIQNIIYPSFAKSVWNQVTGGTALIEFDLKDARDSTSTRITDSTDLKNIATYSKVLSSGIYDIHVSPKNQISVADTFFRFNAVQKEVPVKSKVAAILTASTTDGLITIGKSFIQDGTVPTFKSTTGSTTYKLGLNNGFYYLYIKGGAEGSISFTAKANGQKVTRSLAITSLNQYNMEVVTGNGSLSVVFAPFSYNQVAVGSSTLITLHLNTDIYSSADTYFVVTDESGNILNEVKYIQGTTSIKISSLTPYTKDLINFYDIRVPHDPSNSPAVLGYLQIKKGTIYTSVASLPSTPATIFNLHLGNAPFDQLLVSTDLEGYNYKSLADSTNFFTKYYSSTHKLLVKKLQNSQYLYNIFDIPNTTKDYTIDITKVNKPCLMKTISSPGSNFNMTVYAKSTVSDGIRVYSDATSGYYLGQAFSQYGSVDFYYPSELYAEYNTTMSYLIGNLYYYITTSAATIPDQASAYNASFRISGSSLADFVPTISGSYDYYHANFHTTSAPYLNVDIFSPATANYTAIKHPDFSKYLNVKSVNLSAVKLTAFDLNQVSTFNEGTLLNNNSSTVFGTTTKQVSQRFN